MAKLGVSIGHGSMGSPGSRTLLLRATGNHQQAEQDADGQPDAHHRQELCEAGGEGDADAHDPEHWDQTIA